LSHSPWMPKMSNRYPPDDEPTKGTICIEVQYKYVPSTNTYEVWHKDFYGSLEVDVDALGPISSFAVEPEVKEVIREVRVPVASGSTYPVATSAPTQVTRTGTSSTTMSSGSSPAPAQYAPSYPAPAAANYSLAPYGQKLVNGHYHNQLATDVVELAELFNFWKR